MSVPPYGTDNLLKFLLRKKMQALKNEDKEILAEGVDNLTIDELQNALRDRGMRGTSKFRAYLEMRLKEWLDLSLNHQIPLTLLIMSRTFVITETEKTEDLLKDALSSLSEDVLEDQTADIETDPHKKYQILKAQQEKIEEERQEEEERIEEEKQKDMEEQKQKEEERKETKRKLEEAKEKAKQKQREQEGSEEKDKKPKKPQGEEKDKQQEEESTEEKEKLERKQEVITLLDSAKKEEVVPKPDLLEIIEMDDSELPSLKNLPASKETLSEEDLVDIAEKLASLASSSYVEKEKEMISKLKVQLTQQPKEQVQHTVGRIIEKIEKQEEGEPTVTGLTSRLNSMVNELEQELSDVDQEVGSKYQLLDLDRDGTITVEELAGVVRILKEKYTEDEVREIIDKLDRDKDGKISVDELKDLAKEIDEKEESEK